jgi:hypothetical protein
MHFNIVVDMLAVLISRAKDDGQVGSLRPHLVEGGVSILEYADDTILFMEHDLEKALNMKLLLCIFEQLLGLKINFHKMKFSVLERQKMMKTNTSKFWDVSQDPYLFGILEFLYIIENSVMQNGIRLRLDLFQNLDVGKAIYSHMVIVWF